MANNRADVDSTLNEPNSANSVWDKFSNRNMSIGLTVGDIGAKIYSANNNVPKLHATGPNSNINFAPNVGGDTASRGASTALNNGALAQLDSTVDGVSNAIADTCGVSGISNMLILQEVLGSSCIVLLQCYSIRKVWQALSKATKCIKASKEAIDSIEKDMQILMSAVENLNKMLDEIKEKKEEQLTMDDVQDLLDEVTETTLLYHKVFKPVSKLQFDVGGKIQTLTTCQNTLVCDEILLTGQVLSHLVEFAIYASFPMGAAFWAVKGGFTLVFAGMLGIKGVQHD